MITEYLVARAVPRNIRHLGPNILESLLNFSSAGYFPPADFQPCRSKKYDVVRHAGHDRSAIMTIKG